jgi:hypothetical protein
MSGSSHLREQWSIHRRQWWSIATERQRSFWVEEAGDTAASATYLDGVAQHRRGQGDGE